MPRNPRIQFPGAVIRITWRLLASARRGWKPPGCLPVLEWMAEDSLGDLPKGEERKMVLAWWLRKHSTVSRAWIAQRLQMGHENRITMAVRLIEQTKSRQMKLWKLGLAKLLIEVRRSIQ